LFVRTNQPTNHTAAATAATAATEQAGDIQGNTNNLWSIANVRSPTIFGQKYGHS